MESIWKSTVSLPERETLKGDTDVENLVIGGGMAGILIAFLLQRKGREVMVIEAKRVASGQTGNTTAKITAQHGLVYDKLIHRVSLEKALQYAEANVDAMAMFERLVAEEGIECHLKHLPSFLYTTEEDMVWELRREAEAAKRLGLEARFVKGSRITELPFSVQAAVRFADQMQFHPLEFLAPLAARLEIYENTKALKVRGHQVYTNHGVITAKNIIFATHYPFVNVPGFYFLRQHQERSYVLGLRRGQGESRSEAGRDTGDWQRTNGECTLTGMYYSVDKGGLSLRPYENMLLLGGGSHRTGKSVELYECGCSGARESGEPADKVIREARGYAYLRQIAKEYYPQLEECAAWAAQDCMPHDEVPFIGKYSVFHPYWYVATGFHKWGMTTSMIAAMEISHQIVEGEQLYGKIFAPQRLFMQAGMKNWLVDIGESIKGLWKGVWAEKEYRCPHLGCELQWNEEEQSFDCPCHGSRFSREGELLDNPAQTDLGKEGKPHRN